MPIVKVLVVDNEAVIRAVIREAFVDESLYHVFEAANGNEALALAARERPDVALLDVCMPGIGGIEVLSAFKGSPLTSSIEVVPH